MSSDGLTNDSAGIALEEIQRQSRESPQAELLRRFADQSPTWLMPRLYATQHFGEMLEQSQQRLRDDHIMNLRAQGAEDLAAKWQEGKPDMGAISVQGDTFHIYPGQTAPAKPNGTVPSSPTVPANGKPVALPSSGKIPPSQPTKNGKLNWVWPAVLAAAALGTGAGALSFYNWYHDKPSTVINQPADTTDWKLGARVTDEP